MGSLGRLSSRSLETEIPIMVKILELTEGAKDAMPLGQGAVYWQPPEQALENIKEIAWEPSSSRYGTHEGLPELKEALLKKLLLENKLYKSSVMVTAGSNQGFLNLVLALCDVTDSVVLFAPYFFNSYMSFRMTGITNILVGPSDPDTLQPDADWLENILGESQSIPKLVSIVNPGNPSGTCMPKPLVKAYGMMGWRVGYIAYSSEADGLRAQLLKIQDNVAICASVISQRVALGCLEVGRAWVTDRVKTLMRNKELLIDALSPLGDGNIKGGEGAIFLWAKLPDKYQNDFDVVCWLAQRHGVVLLPGSACGVPGCIRVTFGAVRETECELAAKRLKKGLEELVADGMVAVIALPSH